jgi:uncharacterized membrane protein
LLLWCAALIGFPAQRGGDILSRGLAWNLFLATVPLFWGKAFQVAMLHGRWLLAAPSLCLWIAFLPNAPYILTDIIHLGMRPSIPTWYVMATILSCAGAGTLLGYLSLLGVHSAIEKKFGWGAGWSVAVMSLFGCGYGIYLGRFLRWNSWDIVTRPLHLLRSMAQQFVDPGPFPHPVPVTLIFGAGLIVGYLLLRVIASPAAMRSE